MPLIDQLSKRIPKMELEKSVRIKEPDHAKPIFGDKDLRD